MELTLARALRVSSPAPIAFAGAGGKTTSLFRLARELAPPVIVTATTHFGTWQIPLADQHLIAESPGALKEIEHGLNGVILVTGPVVQHRTTPIRPGLLEWLRGFCGNHAVPLLIEADGSRQKPLKAPAPHEPAIPEFAEQVVYVAGLSCLGQPLTEEVVHRPEAFARVSGLALGEAITPEALRAALSHPGGGLKNMPPKAKRTLLLNQADTPLLQSSGGRLARSMLSDFDAVVVGSLHEQPVASLQVFERTAGILLAAGEAKRFGQPKQLLDWRGQPFVRAVAEVALSAGLTPVVVVTGAYAAQVEAAARDLSVRIARNEEWSQGQASSVRTGIESLSPSGFGKTGVGAAIFLLADQPQIGTDVIRALVEAHTRSLAPVIAPLVLEEKRANPVLFDRLTFPDLTKLEGDTGGRALFSKYPVEYVPWHDDRLLLDVDRPEDYQRLISNDKL